MYNVMLQDMENRPNKVNWAVHVKDILTNLGFRYVWIAQGVGNYTSFMTILTQRIKDTFIQNLESRVSQSSRGLFYKNIMKFELQTYLSCVNVQKFRIALSQLRLSSHRLNIEVGRWSNLDFERRLCPHCHVLEDEFHFLNECDLYKDIRVKYIPRFYYIRPNMFKTIELVTSDNSNILRNLAVFVYKAFIIRKNYISLG